jgi:2-polyprenyl-3-methyl-5-hydroxy-6-metoxy-1,4-benzoquinol methylase
MDLEPTAAAGMASQAHADESWRWGDTAIDPSSKDLPGLKLRYLLEHLPEHGKVIEIGCGEGKILRSLAKLRPQLELHGCDVREPHVTAEGYSFHYAPDGDIPLADASCDVVLIVDVLEHVPDPRVMLKEARRLLRGSGRLVAFVPVEGEALSFYALFRAILGQNTYVIAKQHIQAFSHASLVRLVAEFFEIVDRRFAYHAVGQLLDAGFFAAIRLKSLQRFWWRDNVYYHPNKTNLSLASSAMNKLLQLGNLIAWCESTLLAKSQLGAAGLLFEARPRPERG